MELVSAIYTSDAMPALQTDLATIFSVLSHNYTMTPTHRSSSHIHISRVNPPFTTADLAVLSKATLYFEHALDALMPASRASHWAKSNRSADNPALTGLTLAQCLSKIDSSAAAAAAAEVDGSTAGRRIVETMNLCAPTSRWALAHGRTAPFVRGKTYKWDFTGLLVASPPAQDGGADCGRVAVGNASGGGGGATGGIVGTVEFRQPSGSLTAEDALGWVVLGVEFVAGAVEVGAGLSMGLGVAGGKGGSFKELRGLLEVGREVLGWEDMKSLEHLSRAAGR